MKLKLDDWLGLNEIYTHFFKCTNCGSKGVMIEDKFCSECGEKIEWEPELNSGMLDKHYGEGYLAKKIKEEEGEEKEG